MAFLLAMCCLTFGNVMFWSHRFVCLLEQAGGGTGCLTDLPCARGFVSWIWSTVLVLVLLIRQSARFSFLVSPVSFLLSPFSLSISFAGEQVDNRYVLKKLKTLLLAVSKKDWYRLPSEDEVKDDVSGISTIDGSSRRDAGL